MSVLETLVIIIGIVMGILGNVLILIVMFSNTKLRQLSTSSLIISMAIVDCISAAFTNPLTFSLINDFVHKDCRILNSATLMIFTISINLLVAISADRYWAVCQPISYHVLKSSGYKKWIIAGCVVIGMVIVSPPILGWKKGCFSKGCFYDKTYAKMFDHLDYWIYWTCCATAAIITLYGLIFKSISDRSKRRNNQTVDESDNESCDVETRIAITMGLVIGSFLICWMPLMIHFIDVEDKEGSHDYDSDWPSYAVWAASMNSSLDPLIFALRMQDFRDAARKLFRIPRRADAEEPTNSGTIV